MPKLKEMSILSIIVISGLLLRWGLLQTSQNTLNADEAVMAIMSKHIITRHVFPVFVWAAHYSGVLISYIGVLTFSLFGKSPISFKLGNFPFIIASIVFMYLFTKENWNKKVGFISALLIAVAPILVSTFSVMATAGYSETLAFGMVILFLASRILCKSEGEAKRAYSLFAALGFISGIAFWISPLIIPYFLSLFFIFFIKARWLLKNIRNLLLFIVFFITGALPFIVYNIVHPMATFLRLAGRAAGVSRATFQEETFLISDIFYKWLINVWHSFLNVWLNILEMLGGDTKILGSFFYINLLLIIIYGFSFFWIFKKRCSRISFGKNLFIEDMLYLVGFSTIILYCFAGLDSPRHLIMLYPMLAIFLAVFISRLWEKKNKLALVVLSVILTINLYGNVRDMKVEPLDYRPLINFLESKSLFYGYADYWHAYPVIFFSDERIILSSTLRCERERFEEYAIKVRNAPRFCYILAISDRDNNRLENKLESLKLKYEKSQVSEFYVYWGLSRKLFPEELNL